MKLCISLDIKIKNLNAKMDLKLRDPNFILIFLDMQCSNKGGVLISKKIMWYAYFEKINK